MPSKKPKMTLEKLAQMTMRGFESVTAEMRAGFKASNERFASIDQRFESVDQRFASIDRDLAEVKQAVRSIDFRTQHQVDAIFTDIADLKKRATALEKR